MYSYMRMIAVKKKQSNPFDNFDSQMRLTIIAYLIRLIVLVIGFLFVVRLLPVK